MTVSNKELFIRISERKDIVHRFKSIDEDTSDLINSIIARVLSEYDKLYLLYSILTIIRELMVNSLKANVKRVFFEMNGLNINDANDYETGISMFREVIIGDFDLLHNIVEETDLYIDFSVKNQSDGIIFEVKNNTTILPAELERIKYRMQVTQTSNSFNEIFDDISDEKEGAGLGLMLILMCLKNMGLPSDTFKLNSVGNETIASVFIPEKIRKSEVTGKIKDLILEQIEGIPTFSQNIVHLLDLCQNPEVTIKELSEKVKEDVALSTDVMKLANSAGFISSTKVEEIDSAIMTIGIKNLESILIVSSARKILESRYERFEEIWDHCNKVAAYSRIISNIYNIRKDGEKASLAGLLHDLGKVVLVAVDMKSLQIIADIIKDHSIVTTTVMEEISLGISHSEIGKLIAEKWNLPEFLVELIASHHAPGGDKGKYSDILYIVNLANFFCGVEDRRYYYSYLDITVKDFFRIANKEELLELHEKVKMKYTGDKK